MTVLTDRFTRALDHARIAHAAQVRKGSNIPYLYHLLAVASLVMEFGGDEDQAIAGLLHDVVEDCGQVHERIVRAQFGDRVADIVSACTDGTAEGKVKVTDGAAKREDWMRRKLVYIEHLASAPDDALLVSACDKLHNARAIAQDLEDPAVGTMVFERFTGGREGTLRYYYSLAVVFSERKIAVGAQLAAVVARMHELAGCTAPTLLAPAPKDRERIKSELQPFLDSGVAAESEEIVGLGSAPMGNPIQGATEEQIRTAIDHLRETRKTFSTVDVIRGVLGFYRKDVGAPGGASPNSQFGKKLMKHAHEYGIVRVPPDQTVEDGEGGTTTAAIWRPA